MKYLFLLTFILLANFNDVFIFKKILSDNNVKDNYNEVKILKINDEFIKNLSFLSNFTNLSILDLSHSKYSNSILHTIPELHHLTELNLSGNIQFKLDLTLIDFLSKFPNLTTLKLSNIHPIHFQADFFDFLKTLSTRSKLKNIKILDLSNNNLDDFRQIIFITLLFPNIETINLENNNLHTENLNQFKIFFRNFRAAKSINLSKNNLKIWPVFSDVKLEQLVELNLSYNPFEIKSKPFYLVNTFPNLKSLKLKRSFYNSLSLKRLTSINLSVLKGLYQLDYLDLSDNIMISSLKPLTELLNLKYLFLQNNYIRDLSPLLKLLKLEHLDISFNYYLRNLEFLLNPFTTIKSGREQLTVPSFDSTFIHIGHVKTSSLSEKREYINKLKEIYQNDSDKLSTLFGLNISQTQSQCHENSSWFKLNSHGNDYCQDPITNKIWSNFSDKKLNYQDAQKYCSQLTDLNLRWRLPSLEEANMAIYRQISVDQFKTQIDLLLSKKKSGYIQVSTANFKSDNLLYNLNPTVMPYNPFWISNNLDEFALIFVNYEKFYFTKSSSKAFALCIAE